MKKLLISLIALSLAFALPTQAIAQVKSGDKCKAQGIKNISKGKEFTCIKTGKKLIWNKGTTLSKLTKIAKAEEPTEISKLGDYSNSDRGAIYGQERLGFICWTDLAPNEIVVLQVKKNGTWLNKQIGFHIDDYSLCPVVNTLPVFFSWVIDELGDSPSVAPRAKNLEARAAEVKSDGSIKLLGIPFLISIWPSKREMDADFVDMVNEVMKSGI